jgi:hypothetical protein
VPPPVIAAVNPVTDEGAILKAATELAAPGNPNAILHVPTTAEREGGEAGQRKFEETELVKTRLPLETWAQTQLPTLLDSGVLKLDDLATWPAFASFAPLIEKERLRQAAVVAAADAKDEAKEMRDHIAAEAAAQATEAPTSNQEPT